MNNAVVTVLDVSVLAGVAIACFPFLLLRTYGRRDKLLRLRTNSQDQHLGRGNTAGTKENMIEPLIAGPRPPGYDFERVAGVMLLT